MLIQSQLLNNDSLDFCTPKPAQQSCVHQPHSHWEEETTVRERACLLPSYAKAEKMKSLTLNSNGCHSEGSLFFPFSLTGLLGALVNTRNKWCVNRWNQHSLESSHVWEYQKQWQPEHSMSGRRAAIVWPTLRGYVEARLCWSQTLLKPGSAEARLCWSQILLKPGSVETRLC